MSRAPVSALAFDAVPLPETSGPAPQRWKMLHFTWIAFFLSFVVWFNIAPFETPISAALHLSKVQFQTLMICNLALTIPARIGIGMLVDRFGPRRVFSALLAAAAVPCIACAFATEFWQLVVCRLLISCAGAGFVVGIRLVGEWFDATEIGWAEGCYGGLGNFGMAAALFALPLLAVPFGDQDGWRWAVGFSGLLCAAYSPIAYRFLVDAPPGRTFKKPKKKGALEVCSRGDLLSLCFMQIPMVLCLGVLTWRLMNVKLISPAVSYGIDAALALVLIWQIAKIVRVNKTTLAGEVTPPAERYAFAQVAILCLCYAVTFGGELAVESMLPKHVEGLFKLTVAKAGILSAGFAFASLIARPLGGLLGDRIGRKPIMVVTLGASALGFFAIGQLSAAWSVVGAMALVLVVGFFLMAGNGANFCIAPLIRKPLTGQIAGLIGAYGNVGSVIFLLINTLAGPRAFFLTMTVTGVAAFACCFLLIEPAGRRAAQAKRVALPGPTGAVAGV